MELNNLFLISVSVFAILASLVAIIWGMFLIVVFIKVNKIFKKINELSDFTKETVGDVGRSLKDTSSSIQLFVKGLFTVDAVKKLIMEIIDLIKKRKDKNEKGE